MKKRSISRLSLLLLTLVAVLALAGCGGGGGGGGGFTVTGTTPADGAVVDPATLLTFSVSFSEPLDTRVGTPPSAIETKGDVETDISFIFEQQGIWTDDGKTVTIDVSGYLFKEGASYTITFPAGMKAVDGSTLGADHVVTFTTTATAPFVVSTSPANGETSVATGTFIVINFSEPMDTTSLQKNGTITPAPMTVTAYWSSGDSTLTLDCGTLATDTTYILSLLTGMKDARWSNLAAPVTVAFSTGTTMASGGIRGKVEDDPASAYDDALDLGVAVLFDAPPDGVDPILFHPLSASGAYSIHYLEGGTYYVGAAVDSNGDGEINPEAGDAFGFYPDISSAQPVSVTDSVAYYPTITLKDSEAVCGRVSFATSPGEDVSSYVPWLYAYAGTFATIGDAYLTSDPYFTTDWGDDVSFDVAEYKSGDVYDFALNPWFYPDISVEGTYEGGLYDTGLTSIPAGDYRLMARLDTDLYTYLGFAADPASIAGPGADSTGNGITLYRATIAYGQAQVIHSFESSALYSSATVTLRGWPLTKVLSNSTYDFGYGVQSCIAEYYGAPVGKQVAWHAKPAPNLASTYLGYNGPYKSIEFGTWQEPDDLTLVSRSFVSALAALAGGPGSADFSKAFVAGAIYNGDVAETGITISLSTGETVYYLVPGATEGAPPTLSITGGTRDIGNGPQFFIFNVTPPASGTGILTATKDLESGTQTIPLSAGDLSFADFEKGGK